MEAFSFILGAIKATWWFVTPLILFYIFKESWLYWRLVKYIDKMDFCLLEIHIPQEVLKTPKAMEYVLVGLHGVWDELKLKDHWIKGELLPWFSLEIAGDGGEVHFYIFGQRNLRDFMEAQIYAQYPTAEIIEVEDYTNRVPPNLPNKNWDVWGTDLALVKENAYPLRSYVDFEDMVEERRLDPVASLAETMNKLRPGEHMWVQVVITPTDKIDQLRVEGEKLMAKLMGRPVDEKKKDTLTDNLAGSFTGAFREIMGFPSAEEEKKEDPWASTEFRLSPGEREVLKKIDEKTAKISFDTMIRFIYIGRNDVFSKANIGALFGFFRHFNTYNVNAFKPNSKTLYKKSFLYFPKLRRQFRMMRIVQWYKWRTFLPGGISDPFVLNVEELATIFHLPGQVVQAPTIPRVESKKVSPPTTLPVE